MGSGFDSSGCWNGGHHKVQRGDEKAVVKLQCYSPQHCKNTRSTSNVVHYSDSTTGIKASCQVKTNATQAQAQIQENEKF